MTRLSRLCRAALIALALSPAPLFATEEPPYGNIEIVLPRDAGALTEKATAIFRRVAEEHAGRRLSGRKADATLTILLEPADDRLPAEAFRIEHPEPDVVRIAAGDENGILYGLGRLLHTARFENGRFIPGRCDGVSAPEKTIRGIYLATHFNNFYHAAPIAEVTRYIEELALWGYNNLLVWFDMHHYNGIDDPEARKMQERLAALLRAGRAVGMKTGLTMIANEGYKTTPEHLRAKRIEFTDFYNVEICPAAPGGTELILKQVNECLEAFIKQRIPIDRIQLWPYDQGGCACPKCTPWGSNGYLKISKQISELIRLKLPRTEITLSTWLFDFKEQDKGEWRSLARAFEQEKPWVDYIMADSHTFYPRYLLDNPIPGDLPLLNFPEISMWGNFPWGGYGANPLPDRFQWLWAEVANMVSGGYPYSEGIFEDSNKVIYSQFYWDSGKTAAETLREYISFEFSHEYADRIAEAIGILEKNYGMSSYKWATDPVARKAIRMPSKDFGAEQTLRSLQEIDKKLPAHIRKSWRWRLLILRAFLDSELRKSEGKINRPINRAFSEIEKIQHLKKAHFYVRPPVDFGNIYPITKPH